MLIVSKFHDYYDSAVGEGIDKSIVYDRQTKDISNPWKKFGVDITWSGLHIFGGHYFNYSKKNGWSRNAIGERNWFVVGFRGKLYLGLKVIEYGEYYLQNTETFYYGEDAMQAFENGDDHDRYSFGNSTTQRKKHDTLEFIKKLHGKEYTDTFFKNNIPIFIITDIGNRREQKCEANPILKEWQFFKEKDTFTAFQEIQSFISGVLGTSKEQPAIQTDKDKIVSHGMDTKWSFRNPNPPKRKMK